MSRLFCVVVILTASLVSCRKKDITGDTSSLDSLGRINKWIQDSMERYYYWSGEMSAQTDYSKSPELFFASLLSTKDLYSWITNNGSIPPASTSYFTYGFQYALVSLPGYPDYMGVVTLVNPGGAADKAGIQRGTCFTLVNGVVVNAQSKAAVINALKSNSLVEITPAVYDGTGWINGSVIKLNSRYAGENAIHAVRTFTVGTISTGYIFYNSFDENYDASLLQAFAKLRQAKVSELILDLRYNAGGSVATSAKIASMLADKLSADATWAIFQGNVHEGRKSRSVQEILNTTGNTSGKQFSDLTTRRLTLKRVFILTSAATLSAAELVINNLKPYIEVIQIGETTGGKDAASFTITDERTPRQVYWKLQPIVYKLFNSNNQGGYDKGLSPVYAINDIIQLPLYELGAAADPLVNKALQVIYNNQLPEIYTPLRTGKYLLPTNVIYNSAEKESDASLWIKP